MTEISERKREQIRKEAKIIIDNFSKALDKVKIKKKKGCAVVGGFREEGSGIGGNEIFRKIMFSNTPNKSGDSIIAEKKSW